MARASIVRQFRTACNRLSEAELERQRKNQEQRQYARWKAGSAWAYQPVENPDVTKRQVDAAIAKYMAQKRKEQEVCCKANK